MYGSWVAFEHGRRGESGLIVATTTLDFERSGISRRGLGRAGCWATDGFSLACQVRTDTVQTRIRVRAQTGRP